MDYFDSINPWIARCHHPKLNKDRKGLPSRKKHTWSHNDGVQVYEYNPFHVSEDISEIRGDQHYFEEPHQLIIRETLEQTKHRLLSSPASEQWRKVGIRHHWGISVPIFSLKTSESCGIGEYLDILPLIDWSIDVGLDLIQVLPINDISKLDHSPFSPISSIALNPRLISLRSLPNFGTCQSDAMKSIIEELVQLNESELVEWDQVTELKSKWLWEYFNHPAQQEIVDGLEYRLFTEKNKLWLDSYSVFALLKNKYLWTNWSEWKESEEISREADMSSSIFEYEFAKKLLEDPSDRKRLEYYSFLQYLCFTQMSRVKKYASDRMFLIKGDVTFLVSEESADVWFFRSLFKLDSMVGAPPDDFSPEGQNWNMPSYDWDNKQKQCQWWTHRLQVASEFFHVFRVDHIVGFFRIWAVPRGAKGTEGEWNPSDDPQEYLPQGEDLLRMILSSSDMLPIGEDLGSVPPDVRTCLQNLGICGTKVMRWERRWDQEPDQPYIPFEDYNADSMTTISTHDSETLEQWWRSNNDDIEAFCQVAGVKRPRGENPTLSTDARAQILYQANITPSLFHINPLQEYLALIPSFVHSDVDLERVNVPGQIRSSNWAYRMLPSIETLAREDGISSSVALLTLRQTPKDVLKASLSLSGPNSVPSSPTIRSPIMSMLISAKDEL